MKKFKKLLAGLLAGAMMLGSMTTTAFAEENTATTPVPTINTNTPGSLTINKYEGTDPATAKPLPGVEFTIYKIATIDQVTTTPTNGNPYTEVQFKPVNALGDNISITSATTYKDIKKEVDDAIKNGGLTGTALTTTYNEETKKASVTFSGLGLGVYLVVETNAPSQVVNRTANFLVSIPMAETEEVTNSDGTKSTVTVGWNYDVVANPKNSTVYGGVALVKQGKQGDDTKPLKGATFVLQKKIESNNSWETIENKLTTNENGQISVSDLAPGTYRFVETSAPDGYIMDGTDVKEFVITTDAEGNILVNGQTDNVITMTNYKPDVKKEVKNAAGNWGNDSDYSARDEVPYRVTVDVPENIAKLVDFTLTDTMLRQTYKSGSLKIFKDADLTEEILKGNYEVAEILNEQPAVDQDTATKWSIAFNSKNESTNEITSLLSDYAGKKIYISFSTILGTDAVTTAVGNPNTVKLEYSNKIFPSSNDGNPNTPDTPRNPDKDVISDQATVYTFKIAVEKVDAENGTIKLAGVKFDLYRQDKNGETVNGLTGNYKKVKADLTTDSNGSIEVNGLENGTYYLVETQTNEGYNLLKAPVEVKIQATYSTTTETTTTTDRETGITTTTKVVTTTTFENTGDNGVFKTIVKNSKGFQLPTTGGMGTVIFSVLGIALVLAGLLVITASRKKAAK